MKHEYDDYTQPTSEDVLSELSRLAVAQVTASQELARAEQLVKQRKAELRKISWELIPDLMEEHGIEKFTTKNGLKVEIMKTTRASVLADKKFEALNWLREQGHDALIKRTVKIQFGKGEDAKADEAIKALGDLPVEEDSKVEAPTLSKFVRELEAKGKTVPEELFSVFRQRESNVKI